MTPMKAPSPRATMRQVFAERPASTLSVRESFVAPSSSVAQSAQAQPPQAAQGYPAHCHTRPEVALSSWPAGAPQATPSARGASPGPLTRLQSVPDMRPEMAAFAVQALAARGHPVGPGGSLQVHPGTMVHAVPGSHDENRQLPRAVIASYQMPAADPIDAAVVALLQQEKLLKGLIVKRLGPGQYSLEGNRVVVRWAPGMPPGRSAADLLVSEEHTGNSPSAGKRRSALFSGQDELEQDILEIPLPVYLRQAADVKSALGGRGGANAVSRIPQAQKLSFGGPGVGIEERESADLVVRCASMRQACEEARLREAAAELYHGGSPQQFQQHVQRMASWQGPISAPCSPAIDSHRELQAVTIAMKFTAQEVYNQQGQRPKGGVRLAEALARIEGRRPEPSEDSDSDESE